MSHAQEIHSHQQSRRGICFERDSDGRRDPAGVVRAASRAIGAVGLEDVAAAFEIRQLCTRARTGP